jgi:hypothetical protein
MPRSNPADALKRKTVKAETVAEIARTGVASGGLIGQAVANSASLDRAGKRIAGEHVGVVGLGEVVAISFVAFCPECEDQRELVKASAIAGAMTLLACLEAEAKG